MSDRRKYAAFFSPFRTPRYLSQGLDAAAALISFALGPSLDLGYVIDQNEGGHWLVSVMPTVLFTTVNDESTLFVPLMLGYRWF